MANVLFEAERLAPDEPEPLRVVACNAAIHAVVISDGRVLQDRGVGGPRVLHVEIDLPDVMAWWHTNVPPRWKRRSTGDAVRRSICCATISPRRSDSVKFLNPPRSGRGGRMP